MKCNIPIPRLAASVTVAAAIAVGTSVAAQYPAGAAPQPTAQRGASVTVEGCLVRERDVPGREPNVAERAGIMEDYILTSAKVVKGSAPSSSAAQPDSRSSAQAGSSSSAGSSAAGASSAGQSAAGQSVAGSSAAGQSAAGAQSSTAAAMMPMYQVTGIDDERLQKLLNQRVQVDGVFDDVDQSDARQAGTPATEDLIEIRGSAIRQVTGGQCDAK